MRASVARIPSRPFLGPLGYRTAFDRPLLLVPRHVCRMSSSWRSWVRCWLGMRAVRFRPAAGRHSDNQPVCRATTRHRVAALRVLPAPVGTCSTRQAMAWTRSPRL